MIGSPRILPAALVAAALGVLGSCTRAGSAPADPPANPSAFTLGPGQREKIHVETAARAPFFRTVQATGTVAFDGDRATQVIAPFSGPVARILVELGAAVRRGQPLAVTVSPDFAAAVSAYRKAEATARNAARISTLDQQLFASDGIARRDVEQAETDAISAAADRDAAVQQLRSLGVGERAIADLRAGRDAAPPQGVIRSPLTGTVVERLITPGQLLQAGATPCFTVADTSTVWVMAEIFESDLPFVALGDPAEVTSATAGISRAGTVDNISALVNPDTRAVAVRVVTPNPDGALKKDMYVRVAIRSRRPTTGIMVPVSALLRDDDDLPFVFVENADGSFGRHRVTLGERAGDRQEISAGLAPGERVVVEGGLFMQFAQSQ